MSRVIRIAVVVLAATLTFATQAAPVDAKEIKKFFGTYLGAADIKLPEGLQERNLRLIIKPHGDKGFSVHWTTVIQNPDGRGKVRDLSAKFSPRNRPGVFAAEMKQDVFGNRIPLDPMTGEPFFWAGLKDNTLTVHTLFVNETGGYEMQIYKRTLTNTGIDVVFDRVVDGIPRKTIKATLRRARDCDWKWVCDNGTCTWSASNCRK